MYIYKETLIKNMKKRFTIINIVKLLLFILSVTVLTASIITGCVDKKTSMNVLKADGYTNIKMVGTSIYDCPLTYFYHTKFTAQKSKVNVKGVVCIGLIDKESLIVEE